jgi:hypothetical protein
MGTFIAIVITAVIAYIAGAVSYWYFVVHRKKINLPS